MRKKKIVFDMDDILWGLNEKASKILGIEYEKLVCFSLEDNPYLTDKQRKQLLALYRSPTLWKDIEWYEGATKIKDLEKYGYKVYINSNCMTAGVCDFKRSFASAVFGLPEDQIILNISTEAKKPMRNVLIFADDGPHNIAKSKAKYKLYLDKPWNKEINEGIRCYSFPELMRKIKKIIKEESKYETDTGIVHS